MTRGLSAVAIGLVTYLMVTELVDVLIVGTDTAAVILQDVLPLVVAIGIVIGALLTFIKPPSSTSDRE